MNIRAEVEELISASGAESVSVAYRDLVTQESWTVRPDEQYHGASTIKVCVLMELFRQAEQGKLNLDDKLPIHNSFLSLVDGSSFHLEMDDDSEKGLYARFGEEETLINLAKPMIANSSNLATNLLIERLGAQSVTDFMHQLGAGDLWIRRGVEDGKAYRMGLNNMVAAHGLMLIATRLFQREVVSPRASDAMIDLLLTQAHRNCLPAKLPADVHVAHKTGWNNNICHDFGIIYPKDGVPYVLVVLTRGLAEETEGAELIATISALVYGKTRPCP